MASLTKWFVILLTCWILVGQVGAGSDYSRDFKIFMSLVNGNFSDTAQIDDGYYNRSNIGVMFIPIKIRSLRKGVSFYGEEFLNGVKYREQIGLATEDKDGIITIALYTVNTSSLYRDGIFAIEDLANLKMEDLHANKDCDMVFVKAGPTVFTGTRPDCRHTVGKQHPNYTLTFTCSILWVTVSVNSDEVATTAPYELRLQGKRFPPVIKFPDPCNKVKS